MIFHQILIVLSISVIILLHEKMELLKKITDLIFGTKSVKNNFSTNYPGEKILASDASKGFRTEQEEDIKYGSNWTTSQRAIIILTDKRIKCGQWEIRLDEIENAKLVKVSSMFIPVYILKLKTTNKGYFQFGMQMNQEWVNQTVLPLELEEGKLKYSYFSLAIRIFIIAYLVHWIIKRFF